jgi:hypothetical protein
MNMMNKLEQYITKQSKISRISANMIKESKTHQENMILKHKEYQEKIFQFKKMRENSDNNKNQINQ